MPAKKQAGNGGLKKSPFAIDLGEDHQWMLKRSVKCSWATGYFQSQNITPQTNHESQREKGNFTAANWWKPPQPSDEIQYHW